MADRNVRPLGRVECDSDRQQRAASILAATDLIVRTALIYLLQVLQFGNATEIASYVADGAGSDGGLDFVFDFVGATGRKCLYGTLGNWQGSRRRNRVFVDN